MKKAIKKFANKLLYPNTYSSDAYIKYLRKCGCTIGENNHFVSPKHTFVDVRRAKYITIGNNCCFSVVSIFAHDFSWYVFARSHNDILPDSGGEVKIGNNVFVGYKTVILKNVTIGDNVIIGAYSVVTKNIPSNTVWAGSPARMICTLDELYERRKADELNTARYFLDFFCRKNNRYPNSDELEYFSFLFLERTEENYDKYIKKLRFNNVYDDPKLKELFFSSKPQFNSYEDFISNLSNKI